MAQVPDGREGLSPPPATIYDLLAGDGEFDDDIYEPATENADEDDDDQDEDYDEDESDDDEEDEYMDAIEQLVGEAVAGGEEDITEEEETNAGGQPVQYVTRRFTLRELRELLSHQPGYRHIFRNVHLRTFGYHNDVDDDDDDDDDYPYGLRRRRRRKGPADPDRFPKVPSDAGRMLMYSGVYGANNNFIDVRRQRRRNVGERLLWRRLGLDARSTSQKQNRYIAQQMVPNTTNADRIIHYDSRAYSGQFSDDGNFFFSCTQNFKVRMYDTSNPYDWKYYKTVDYPYGQWTITDATLSPDNKFLAYSSIRHTVCLAPTDPTDHSEPMLLDFSNYARSAADGDHRFNYVGRSHGFGIWSLRFSGDGREIVAGTSDSAVLVYDLETRKTILKLTKHTDDVNAVCFGDKSSPHILYSGSDDQTLRVWDRRSMADRQEAGVFIGHTEGLTYVDSKGDGRYVLSNGKDQMMKLWDLRKMVSPADFSQMDLSKYTVNFDYRFSNYDDEEYIANPNDCSVVTFRGHRVLKTLIRCHFSPPTSSNSRYVYSGSEDGKVWIYNMDGTVKDTVDVEASTRYSRVRNSDAIGNGYDMDMGESQTWKTCVRDASWSPTAPILAATSWNGWGMSAGTVSVHSWNDGADQDEGQPPMGTGYDARLDLRPEFNVRSQDADRQGSKSLRSRRLAARQSGRNMASGGDDEEEDGGW